jgi:hypothetical protein
MAEERTASLEGEVVLAMQRLLVRQEAHIQEWTALWDHIFHSTHNDFRQAQSWQDFGAATDLTQRRVEWMSMPENSGVLMSERL